SALLGDGRHSIRVVATDQSKQETASEPTVLKIDRRAPVVRSREHGRVVSVRVVDRPRRASGARGASTIVSFGDGKTIGGTLRARHRYRRPGVYKLAVKTRDRAGNVKTMKRRIRVR